MLMGTPATAGREGGDLEELHRRIAEAAILKSCTAASRNWRPA